MIDWNSQITRHFAWWEVARTDHRTLADVNRQHLLIDATLRGDVLAFAGATLEPLRSKHGKPWVINSWYRCPELNTAVGGNPSSRHMLGTAIDFTVPGQTIAQTFEEVKALLIGSGLYWDELLLEPLGRGPDRWIHFSAMPARPGFGPGRRLVQS